MNSVELELLDDDDRDCFDAVRGLLNAAMLSLPFWFCLAAFCLRHSHRRWAWTMVGLAALILLAGVWRLLRCRDVAVTSADAELDGIHEKMTAAGWQLVEDVPPPEGVKVQVWKPGMKKPETITHAKCLYAPGFYWALATKEQLTAASTCAAGAPARAGKHRRRTNEA